MSPALLPSCPLVITEPDPEFICHVHGRDREVHPPSPEQVTYFKKMAAETIWACRRKKKPKEAVNVWIEEHYPTNPANSHPLRIPDTIREMIVDGVHEQAPTPWESRTLWS
jgi:hypothetical protein